MQIFPEVTGKTTFDATVQACFWKRQFNEPRTQSQVAFDVVFGVVGPILCFFFDPVVFRSGLVGPLFPDYQTFVYLFSGIQILLLCFWLIIGSGPEFSNALIGGAMSTGSFLCLVIGCALLPYSLWGLMVGIGLFGFTPFLTAFVYARNGYRALSADPERLSVFTRTFGILCGFILAVGLSLPLSIQIRSAVTSSVHQVIHADAVTAPRAAKKLTVLKYFADDELDRIVRAYMSERDERRKQIMRSAYLEITGQDLEPRARILMD